MANMFGKMMASCPIHYIKGIGMGVAAGGLYGGTGRRGSVGRAASYGLAGAGIGAASIMGAKRYGASAKFGYMNGRFGGAGMGGSILSGAGMVGRQMGQDIRGLGRMTAPSKLAAQNLMRNPEMIKGVGQGLMERATTLGRNIARMVR